MRYVTITSINPPHERLTDFLDAGYEVVVTGDESTDDRAWQGLPRGIHYLNLGAQRELAPDLDVLTGTRTYARKNFSYLWAIASGAQVIWETDDDTFTRNQVGDPLAYLATGLTFATRTEGVWNPYTFFAPGSGLWPRGFPLELIHQESLDAPHSVHPASRSSGVGILQLLVSGEPDLDAIYRLTVSSRRMEFDPVSDVVTLTPGTFAPGNTQATFWLDQSTFEWLYLPRWVSFRYCDIMKLYVAQTRCQMSYAGFLMEQIRNPHDFLEDFRSEVPVYLGVRDLLTHLRSDQAMSLEQLYAGMASTGLCDSREVETAAAFGEALRAHTPR